MSRQSIVASSLGSWPGALGTALPYHARTDVSKAFKVIAAFMIVEQVALGRSLTWAMETFRHGSELPPNV
jgi:hypothetical protein